MDEEVGNVNPAMISLIYPGQQDQVFSAGRRYATPEDSALMWTVEELILADLKPNFVMFSVVGVDDDGKGWGFTVCHSGEFTLHWNPTRLPDFDNVAYRIATE